jgi:hypothetical protein
MWLILRDIFMMENDVNISFKIPASYEKALADLAMKKFGPDATIGHALRDIIPSALGLPPIQKTYRSQTNIRSERAKRWKEVWECVERLGSYKAASIELGVSVLSISNAYNRHYRTLRMAALKIERNLAV